MARRCGSQSILRRLHSDTSILGATIDNAWLMNKETEIGSITAWNSADFVVLEQSLFEVEPHEISKVAVQSTWYRGRKTFGND